MELNKQMQEVLDRLDSLNPIAIETLTPSLARQLPELKDAALMVMQEHATKRILSGFYEPVGHIEHILIPGPGGQLLARLYKPRSTGPHPVLLYFHGGGWVLSNLNSYDTTCRALANAAGCIVLSVSYRQAPEHKYPAAHEDAWAAYRWLLDNTLEIGGKDSLVAVGGEDAGGNLAATICLQARESGTLPPVHQLLVSPILGSRLDTPSYRLNSHARPLNRARMTWYFKHYFRGAKVDPKAFPLHSKDFDDLPSATIITAELDPLYSEGEIYAGKLRDAGIQVFHHRYKGVSNGFFGLPLLVDEARNAIQVAASQLKRAFDLFDMDNIENRPLVKTNSIRQLDLR